MSRTHHWHPKTLKSIQTHHATLGPWTKAYDDADKRAEKHGGRWGANALSIDKETRIRKEARKATDPIVEAKHVAQRMANSLHKRIDKNKAKRSLKNAAKHVLKKQKPYRKLSKQTGYR